MSQTMSGEELVLHHQSQPWISYQYSSEPTQQDDQPNGDFWSMYQQMCDNQTNSVTPVVPLYFSTSSQALDNFIPQYVPAQQDIISLQSAYYSDVSVPASAFVVSNPQSVQESSSTVHNESVSVKVPSSPSLSVVNHSESVHTSPISSVSTPVFSDLLLPPISFNCDQSLDTSPQQSNTSNYPVWKREALASLTSNPMFNELQTELHSECNNSGSIPLTLLQTTPQQSDKHSLPISVRQRMLQLRFMMVKTKQRTKSSELQNFYNIQASKLESERSSELVKKADTPWLHEGLNLYFDSQHHQLINRVEQSLSLIEDITSKQSNTKTIVCEQRDSEHSQKNITPRDGKYRFVSSYNPLAVRVMSNWYERNKDHPYPSIDTCEIFAKTGSISVEQVKKWFANRRMRERNTKSLGQIAKERKTRKRTFSPEGVLLQDHKRQCTE